MAIQTGDSPPVFPAVPDPELTVQRIPEADLEAGQCGVERFRDLQIPAVQVECVDAARTGGLLVPIQPGRGKDPGRPSRWLTRHDSASRTCVVPSGDRRVQWTT